MKQNQPPNDLKGQALSPEARAKLKHLLHESLAAIHGENWAALQMMESKEDVEAANARISRLQGPSPRDRAWLTPIDPEPPQVPGWDKSNRVNLAVAKQVHDEYVAAGKIHRQEISGETDMRGDKSRSERGRIRK